MADNGHCSTCQTHNTKNGCGSKIESFKNLFGSEVQQNEEYLKLESIMPDIISGQTLVTKDTWTQLQTTLQAIKDYGELAEDNPDQDKINQITVDAGNLTFLNDYNKILNALDKNNITGSQLISKDLIDTLKQNIKTYNINAARCNVCNTSCQNCQSDCDSDYGGGGGGDGGCHCGGCSGCDAGGERYDSCPGGWESARIYKENIQDYIQNAVELINSINIVEFNYKNDPEKNQKIGFIADDTDAQLASKNHNIMDIYNCIGILLKAVQELSAEIKELKNQNKEE